SSVSLRRDPLYSTYLKQRFRLKEAGFISTLTTAAGIRTKRDRYFRRPMTPWRMPLLLPRNSRKMAAGTDHPFSLRTTGDTRLSVREWAGRIARAFLRDKIDRLFRQPTRGAGKPLTISG